MGGENRSRRENAAGGRGGLEHRGERKRKRKAPKKKKRRRDSSYRVALDLRERERGVVDLAADVTDARDVRQDLHGLPAAPALAPLLSDDGVQLLCDGTGGNAPDSLSRRGAAPAGHGTDAVSLVFV